MDKPIRMKKLFQLYVPVPNYECNGLRHQELFILSDYCPTKGEWLSLASDYHNRDSKYAAYLGDWEEVLSTIQSVERFPYLTHNDVRISSQVTHPKFGKIHIIVVKRNYANI